MIKLIKKFPFIDKKVFLKLYKAMIRPRLEYAKVSLSLIKQFLKNGNFQRQATKNVPTSSLKDLTYSDKRDLRS